MILERTRLLGVFCLLLSITSIVLDQNKANGFALTATITTGKRTSCSSSLTRQEPRQRVPPFHLAETDEDSSNVDDSTDASGAIDKSPVEQGSHKELMYALGVNLARQLGDIRPLVNTAEELAAVAKGLLDTVIGRFEEESQAELLQRRGQELNELIAARAEAIRQRLEEAGREMLQSMEKQEGVKKLPSGVLIQILEHGPDGPGKGIRPTQASTVKIHYHGTLADGTVFDSTLARGGGEPMKLPLARVIPGWRDGVLKMHQGETAMLGIPPDQGYGDKGTPDGTIPGGSTLFFKIQLLEVMTAGIQEAPSSSSLIGMDGKSLDSSSPSTGLLGADGKPL